MRRLSVVATLTSTCVFSIIVAFPSSAIALRVAPANPGPLQIAQSDAIVVGQVVQMLDQDIQASPAKGSKQKVAYRVAIMRVTDTIKGKIKGNVIRVAYPAPQVRPQPVPGGIGGIRPVPVPRPGIYRGTTLTIGMDGMFFLNKHHEGDFYTMPQFWGFVSRQNNQAFDQKVKETRNSLKVAADPMGSLKSKDAQTRLLAASMMISKYRTFSGSRKTKPVNAEESQLILKTLLEANWDYKLYRTNYQNNPQNLFNQLGVTPNDGFQRPKPRPGQNYNQVFEQAAKNWLRTNVNTYRIQQYEKGPNTGVRPGGPIRGVPVPALPGNPVPIQIQPGKIQVLPARPGQVVPPPPVPQIQVDVAPPVAAPPPPAPPVPPPVNPKKG